MIKNNDMAKILIAEDEEPIRIGLVDTLESEGYEVVAVPDGQEALDRSADGGFDLYVLDIMMPKVSHQTLRRPRTARPNQRAAPPRRAHAGTD